MGILTKNQKEIIEYRLQAAQQALEAAELLAQHRFYNAAVVQLRAAAFQHIAGLLVTHHDEASSIDEAFELMYHWPSDELSPADRHALKQLENLASEAELRLSFQVAPEQYHQTLADVRATMLNIRSHIDAPGDWVPEVLSLLRKHAIANARGRATRHTDSLIRFLDNEMLQNAKEHDALHKFVANPHDLKAEGALEIILDHEIDQLPTEKRIAFDDLCSQAIDELRDIELPSDAEAANTASHTPSSADTPSLQTEHSPAETHLLHHGPVVVPWDFTELASKALTHAAALAQAAKVPLCLLHIVKKQSDIGPALQQLEALAATEAARLGIEVQPVVRAGNIFTDISEEADNRDALMVVMGTHGLRGMQKITGSWALKVIADTKAPFLVIQDLPRQPRIEQVVLPITHVRDLKKLLNEVLVLHELFRPTFHLVRIERYPTESFKKQSITNFVFLKSFLKQNQIAYTETEAPGSKDYYEAGLKHVKQTQADLMMILTSKDINSIDFVMGAEEQKVIANTDRIAILCVNPKHGKTYTVGAVGF